MQDLATLVHDQGEVIDSIEANVESTHVRVQEGTEQLRQAENYKVRWKIFYYYYSNLHFELTSCVFNDMCFWLTFWLCSLSLLLTYFLSEGRSFRNTRKYFLKNSVNHTAIVILFSYYFEVKVHFHNWAYTYAMYVVKMNFDFMINR